MSDITIIGLVILSVLTGFIIGARLVFRRLFAPACTVLESTCSAGRDDGIMDALLHSPYPDEGRAMANLFYIFYRFGYVFRHNNTSLDWYVSAVKNNKRLIKLLKIFEKLYKYNVEKQEVGGDYDNN